MTESDVQNLARLNASKRGWRLWRNNSGALPDANGRPVRFGLGNDSSAASASLKASDLIGIAPTIVTQAMVGTCVGLFVSVECKSGDWRPIPSDKRWAAQSKWLELVRAMGGRGVVTTDGELP